MFKRSIKLNSGDRFGKLTIIKESNPHKGRRYYLCKCDCGKIKEVYMQSLTHGLTTSCGCKWHNTMEKNYKKEVRCSSKGYPKSKLYATYRGMIERCYDSNNKDYIGNKGIRVYSKWKNDFMEFYKWSINNGFKFGKKQYLRRINKKLDYKPSNCKWYTISK